MPNGNLFVTLLRAGGRSVGGDPEVVAEASPNVTLPPAAAPRPRSRGKSPANELFGVTPSEHRLSTWSLAQTADDNAKFFLPALLFGSVGLTICVGIFLFRGCKPVSASGTPPPASSRPSPHSTPRAPFAPG